MKRLHLMRWFHLQTLRNRREEARAYSNLGSAFHSQRDFDKAISYHTRVLELAQEQGDRAIEMRAYAGLGHAARCMQVGLIVLKAFWDNSVNHTDIDNNLHAVPRTWREPVSTTSTNWKSVRSCRTEQLRAEPRPTWVGLSNHEWIVCCGEMNLGSSLFLVSDIISVFFVMF